MLEQILSDMQKADPCLLLDLLQRLHMPQRKVYYMDIVTNTRAVMGIVIIPEDTQFFQLAHCHLCRNIMRTTSQVP